MNISVIVPVYNNASVLRERMRYLLKQDYDDFELILVDDGSTDGSADICDELKKESDKIKVFHKQNGGASSARNLGISNAQGKYIMFCDADDDMEADTLGNVAECIKKTNADLVIGGFRNILVDKDRCTIQREESLSRNYREININEDCIDPLWKENNMISACGKIFVRNTIVNNNISFNESLVLLEDYCFVLDYLSCCNKVVTLDKNTYNYWHLKGHNAVMGRSRADFVDDVVYADCKHKLFLESHNTADTEALWYHVCFNYYAAYQRLWAVKTVGIKERINKYKRIKQVMSMPQYKKVFEQNKHYFSPFMYYSLKRGSIIGVLLCNLPQKSKTHNEGDDNRK